MQVRTAGRVLDPDGQPAQTARPPCGRAPGNVSRALPLTHAPGHRNLRQVFDGTVGGDMEALGRLTEDDLRFLVRHQFWVGRGACTAARSCCVRLAGIGR